MTLPVTDDQPIDHTILIGFILDGMTLPVTDDQPIDHTILIGFILDGMASDSKYSFRGSNTKIYCPE